MPPTPKLKCPGWRGHPCGNVRDRPGQRYCAQCHASYQRWWRAERKRELETLRADAEGRRHD